MTITIRPLTESASDEAALSEICLLTADAGQSAEHNHAYRELPGLFHALLYRTLPATFGFVMETESGKVVGYAIGTTDTDRFQRAAAEEWWPKLKEDYPTDLLREARDLKWRDRDYIRTLHCEDLSAPSSCTVLTQAQMNMNILPEYLQLGWETELFKRAMDTIKEKGEKAVWLWADKRNTGARKFYNKVGFQDIEDAPDGCMWLKFEDFCEPEEDIDDRPRFETVS